MQEEIVIIVGAGPSGLSAAACLRKQSIPFIILEREDCFASIWQKYAYDCLHLHLKKQFCELPHLPFPPSFPDYVPKKQFLQYLADYVSHFKITPFYRRNVELAEYDQEKKKWTVRARNGESGEVEEYVGRFLVVATGENADPFIPEIKGLGSFNGRVIHSTRFKSGKEFKDKHVLVVGSGNSGMEIAHDLADHGAKTSIVIRSPVHILSRKMINMGLFLLKYLSLNVVDSLLVTLSKIAYGDMTKYGIGRPKEGPFFMRDSHGKYPVVDIGTCQKIRSGEIKVLSAEIESIRGNDVVFKNGKLHSFDSIIFCTGFKRSTHRWLEGDDYLLNDDGFPKPSFPDHWKGKNDLYCVGLARRGLNGSASDAKNVANDISFIV